MKFREWAIWLTAIGVFISAKAGAQNYFIEQALLFSRQNAGGSARIQAMGGAQVALGGDFSSARSNPAALGFYNRNEFSITPALTFQNASGNYTTYENGQNNLLATSSSSSSSSSILSLPGLAIVFGADKNTDKAPFYGGTFAITLSRLNDFNGTLQYNGQNNGSSIVAYFLESATGYQKDQFDPKYDPNTNPAGKGDNVNTPTYLGFNNYLIGPKGTNSTDYFSDLGGKNPGKPEQKEIIKTSGSQNQWSISYGANFLDKLFLGAGLGITSVRYQYDKTYIENFEGQKLQAPCNTCFNNLNLNEKRTTSGGGVNLTLGALVKPIDYLQFGITYVTPTAYQLNDRYDGKMTTSWNNYDYYGKGQKFLNNESSKTIDDPVNYGLSTPGRVTFGAAFIIPKKGFITADVELVNYSNASTSNFSQQYYSLSYDAGQDINKPIASRFKSVTNIRIGGEYRLKKFRIRAGYNLMDDPYANKPDNRINYSLTNLSSITGGVGYRTSKFFIDLAVVHTQGDGYYTPYAVTFLPGPDYNYTNTTDRILFTLGFPF